MLVRSSKGRLEVTMVALADRLEEGPGAALREAHDAAPVEDRQLPSGSVGSSRVSR
jgi:hypothetical protein